MSGQFVPPWLDKAMLCRSICASDTTVDNWVAQGILPPPRKRGGKLMWKWAEVDERLTVGKVGGSPDDKGEEIYNGTREEAAARRH